MKWIIDNYLVLISGIAVPAIYALLKLAFRQTNETMFISIACGFSIFLFSPDDIINNFGLIEYRKQVKPYFGIFLFVCIVIIIYNFIIFISCRFYEYIRKKRLCNLTDAEKNILAEYINNKTRTCYLNYSDGVVKGLEHETIIYRSSDVNSYHHGLLVFSYNIQPWAWDYLNKNPNIILINKDEI
ncbi:MAG: super-infection exclusion protein B [Methylomonas sp.]|jgi:hypothetical protein